MKISHLLTVAALMAALPLSLAGQSDDASWEISLTGGGIVYQDASSMTEGASIGLDAMFRITPRLAIGPSASFVRTETDGSFYVAVLNFGTDSTGVFQVGQRIHSLHYGVNAQFDLVPDSRFNPFVSGGVGAYTLYLETQSIDGFSRLTELMFQFGGGIEYAVSDAAGVTLSVHDLVYTNFDRSELNPVPLASRNCPTPGRSAACRFPEAERADLPDAEETLHNIRFSIGLSYIPGRN